jgi:hypothetical protein
MLSPLVEVSARIGDCIATSPRVPDVLARHVAPLVAGLKAQQHRGAAPRDHEVRDRAEPG